MCPPPSPPRYGGFSYYDTILKPAADALATTITRDTRVRRASRCWSYSESQAVARGSRKCSDSGAAAARLSHCLTAAAHPAGLVCAAELTAPLAGGSRVCSVAGYTCDIFQPPLQTGGCATAIQGAPSPRPTPTPHPSTALSHTPPPCCTGVVCAAGGDERHGDGLPAGAPADHPRHQVRGGGGAASVFEGQGLG